MVEQAAVALGAPRVEPGPGPFQGRFLPGADGEDGQAAEGSAPEELGLRRHGREAAHRGAVAEAAGVERDDVPPGRDRRRDLPEAAGHEALDLHHRAAAVVEQRPGAASRIGRQVPDHGDADHRAARVPVAQRHPGGGALEPAVAGAPAQHRNRWRRRRRNRAAPTLASPMPAGLAAARRAGRGHQAGGEQNGRSRHGGRPREAASCPARRRAHGREGSGPPAGYLSGDVSDPPARNHLMWSSRVGPPSGPSVPAADPDQRPPRRPDSTRRSRSQA